MTIRLDKWLYHARFFKTRSRAQQFINAGHVRLNAQKQNKSATSIKIGDTLTFALNKRICVIRITALATRRGPARQARTLYTELPTD